MSSNPFAPAAGGAAPAKPVRPNRPPPPNPFASGSDAHGDRPKSVAKPSFLKSDSVNLSSASTLSSEQHSPPSLTSPKETSSNPFGPPPVPVLPPSPTVSNSNPFAPSVEAPSTNPFAPVSPTRPSAVPPPLPPITRLMEEDHHFTAPPVPSVPIPETPKVAPPPVPLVPPTRDFSPEAVSTPVVPPPKPPTSFGDFDRGFTNNTTANGSTGFEVDALASSWDHSVSVSGSDPHGFQAPAADTGFDFPAVSSGGFDSFSAPANDDFGFSPASTGFDSFGQAAPAVPPPVPPVPAAPVVEEDPYEIVVNKPPPKPFISHEPPRVPSRRESVPPKNKSTGGDPFATLVPLKPAAAPPVVPPVSYKPMKDFMSPEHPAASTLPILEAPAPQVDEDPYEIHVTKPKAAGKPAAAAGFDDFGATGADPFAQPTATAGFGFDSFGSPNKSDPFAAPAASSAGFDSFGFAPTTSSSDPFANPAPVVTAKPAPIVPSDADFDIFDKPAKVSNPFHPTLPPKTHHVPATSADLDIFNSPPKTNKAPLAAAANPPPNIFSPTSKPRPTPQPTESDLDIFNAPVSLSAPPGPLLSTAPKAAPQPRAAPAPMADDPFSVGFETDPFAAAPVATGYRSENLLDDPFEDDFQSQSHRHEEEDPMKKLRQVYDLRKNSDASESHLSDNFSDSDIFDDDVDNYESKYIRKRDAPAQQPISNKGVTAASAGMKGRYDIDESELMDGEILSRLSTKSLVTKDWHDTYYVIKGNALYLYRNKLDYQYNPNGTNYKKKIPITHNLRVLQIKAKEYKGLGPVYNFMLEEVLDYGPSNVGKFGSTFRIVIETLWKRLRYLILKRREARANPAPQYGK